MKSNRRRHRCGRRPGNRRPANDCATGCAASSKHLRVGRLQWTRARTPNTHREEHAGNASTRGMAQQETKHPSVLHTETDHGAMVYWTEVDEARGNIEIKV